MPGSSTRTKTRSRDSIVFNALDLIPLTNLASITTAQAPTVIQDGFNLPMSAKILGAAVYYASIGAPDGTYTFNIVAGTGTYETAAGTYATNFGTAGGTVQTGDVITFLFTVPQILLTAVGAPTLQPGLLGYPPVAGSQQIPFVYIVKATDTTATVLAASIIAAFNGSKNAVADVIYAWGAGTAVVNFTTLQTGNAATTPAHVPVLPAAADENAITWVASVTTNPTPGSPAATTTFVVNALTFAGATDTTGVVVGVNDQFEYTGKYNYAPATSAALGATPIFNSDMPIFLNVPGGMCYWSSNFDTIYQQGTTITLRMTVPATPTLTNFKVVILAFPIDVLPQTPTFYTFDVHNDIG